MCDDVGVVTTVVVELAGAVVVSRAMGGDMRAVLKVTATD